MSTDYGSVDGYGIDISNVSYKGILNLLEKLNTENMKDTEDIKTALINKDNDYINEYSNSCGLCGISGIVDDIITGDDRYGIFFVSEDDDYSNDAYIMYQSPTFKTDRSQFFTKEEIDERLLELADILGLKDAKPDWCSTHWYG